VLEQHQNVKKIKKLKNTKGKESEPEPHHFTCPEPVTEPHKNDAAPRHC
jgi:hypothetical protein